MRPIVAGLLSGGVVLAAMLALRMGAGYAFLPELAAQKLFTAMPLTVELFFVRMLFGYAKYVGFGLVLIGFLSIYGFLGVVFGRFALHTTSVGVGLKIVGFTSVVTLLVGGVLSPLAAGALFTSRNLVGSLTSAGVLFIIHMVFTLLLYAFTRGIHCPTNPVKSVLRPATPGTPSRRIFIRTTAAASVGLILISLGIGFLFSQRATTQGSPRLHALPSIESRNLAPPFSHATLRDFAVSEVTSNEEFFVVSQNVFDPKIVLRDWRLLVDGDVSTPLRLTYEDLTSMSSTSQFVTLECIGNPLGGPYIGTAEWSGVLLRELLERAGVRESGRFAVFHCADQYSAAIPLEKAMSEPVLLAYSMNGEQLTPPHGFPLRAMVPGLYGVMNPKWIVRIEILGEEGEGFWRVKGTGESSEVYTQSYMKIPRNGETLSGLQPIAGVAFSGDRGITKVEVSDDEGKTWVEATLKEPLSPYTWVLWAKEWLPKSDGQYALMVRATDKTGRTQVASITEAAAKGVMGYHVINVTVQREASTPDV